MVPSDDRVPPHERILTAVLRLLDEDGEDAVSTRAVESYAHVQAPAIYRLFGDKQGLLEAAVERGYADWVAAKGSREMPADPVDALRAGWDDAVSFGLSHPAMYRIANARTARSPALSAGADALRGKMSRVAAAGRLRVNVDDAVTLMQASARGVTLTLIDSATAVTDGIAGPLNTLAREAILGAITTDPRRDQDGTITSAATALQALLPQSTELRPAEQALMNDWLDRLSRPASRQGDSAMRIIPSGP